MSQQSRRFATGKLIYKTGTEGPRHDPYGYEEWTIVRGDVKATLHLGLAEWYEDNVNDNDSRRSGPAHHLEGAVECVAAFEKFAGISLKTCERAIHRYLPCCAHPAIRSFAGYPGETIDRCESCGKVVDYDFDIGAVL